MDEPFVHRAEGDMPVPPSADLLPPPEIVPVDLGLSVETTTLPRLDRPLAVNLREVRLLDDVPWVRTLGKLQLEVQTQGWRFPTPPDLVRTPPKPRIYREGDANDTEPASGAGEASGPCQRAGTESEAGRKPETNASSPPARLHGPLASPGVLATPGSAPLTGEVVTSSASEKRTRLRPPADAVVFKDRLLYLLQPPLEDLFAGRQVELPFKPFPYQVQGIAFLMPRHAALIADEMGLGKTMQTIVALRLLFHGGLIRKALVVCPKPLVINWTRELRMWAEDIPFEVIGGDADARRASWFVSNCPLKLVNYELLTRDASMACDDQVHFDVVVLDEAQRIKNSTSKTAQVVRAVRRDRSWAMTGTPIENRIDDLVNIFAFVDPDRIPPETPAKRLPALTSDCILRRTKEEVVSDMPPKIIHDSYLELTPGQRQAYEMAEKEGVIQLNALGDTITVQHVFELVMRLKQICNFDPLTGQSAKMEQLLSDMAEVAENGRKAIIFSQWVEPLEILARELTPYGPLLYHGKIAHKDRQPILDRFKSDPSKHVILMSYGTGSVGLNLQFTNYVFLFDRWWNPAIEDQAINRAHRLGQKGTVFVTRFICQGTIEGRIAEVLEKKRQLFNELIEGTDAPSSMGLTEDDIFGLFDIRARPKRAAA